MRTIDYHYYATFDGVSKPFYDWVGHVINVGCNRADINIESTTDVLNEQGTRQIANLIHEYIHFLQNFSTAWGAPVFCDLTLASMKIGVSSIISRDNIDFPINISSIKNKHFASGLKLRNDVLQRIDKGNFAELYSNAELSSFELTVKGRIAELCNGRIRVELGLKLIREHMAHMGTQLFLGKSDEQIQEYNRNCGGFKRAGREFSNMPEYWIFFEYVLSLSKFTGVARGIFYLMQQCLATINPEHTLSRFTNWLNTYLSGAESGVDFTQVLEEWINVPTEVLFFERDRRKSIRHCRGIMALCHKHMDEHELFKFTYNIAEFAVQNLKGTNAGSELFSKSDDLDSLQYWKAKMARFGTGIVRYMDEVVIHGTAEYCARMAESYYSLLSTSLVISRLINNQKSFCPFLEDIPICTAEYRDSDLCIRNPFFMIRNEPSEEECLFGNGVKMLGLQNRVNFNS